MNKDTNKQLLLDNPLVNGLFWVCLAATIVFMAIACAIAAPYDTFASFLDVKTAFLANVRFRVYLSLSIVAAGGVLTVVLITMFDNIIQLYFKRPQVSTQPNSIVHDEIATPASNEPTPEESQNILMIQHIIDREKIKDIFDENWSKLDDFCDDLSQFNPDSVPHVYFGRILHDLVNNHPEVVRDEYKMGNELTKNGVKINFTRLIKAYYSALGIKEPSPNQDHYEILTDNECKKYITSDFKKTFTKYID